MCISLGPTSDPAINEKKRTGSSAQDGKMVLEHLNRISCLSKRREKDLEEQVKHIALLNEILQRQARGFALYSIS